MLQEVPIRECPILGLDLASVGSAQGGSKAPYIKGHVTDGSTFTFQVNGSDVSVSVDASGNWKYKPTATITSLAFVGVPELDSLTLCKINGLQTFNLDYPVVPTYKNCDATTQNALEYVYHIRGTATDNFQFTLKYVDDNNTVTTVTESAVIDGNGKWDVAYSGKKISGLYESFRGKVVKSVIITENCNKVTTMYGTFRGDTIEEIDLSNATFDICTDFNGTFQLTPKLKRINLLKAKFDTQANQRYTFYNIGEIEEINLPIAKFDKCTDVTGLFAYCSKLKKVNIPNVTFESVTTTANSMNAFQNSKLISELIVPNTSLMSVSINFKDNVLDYDSMLRVAGWLKDLTGGTAQTVTFKADTYNALTAEQKAALTANIVTQKGWNLATA